MKFAHHPFVRKGLSGLLRASRTYRRATATPADYAAAPPVLGNSFPKSGTNLLLQVLRALPGTRSYGSVLASVPSIRFRMCEPAAMRRRIHSLAPGEVAMGHLFWNADYAEDLAAMNAASFFIYRDPRAVVVSEMHYLTRTAWWHGLHRRFVALADDEERLLLSIRGMEDELPNEYPNVRRRFARYASWLSCPDTCAVRFEELRGEGAPAAVSRIVEHFAARSTIDFDAKRVIEQALAAIRPEQSHTFRSGATDSWRREFTPRVAAIFDETAGELIQELGYEPTLC